MVVEEVDGLFVDDKVELAEDVVDSVVFIDFEQTGRTERPQQRRSPYIEVTNTPKIKLEAKSGYFSLRELDQ